MGSIAEFDGYALYLNQHVQSHHVFDYMLDKIGGADKIIISSFAITEHYIRRIIRNRNRIGRVELVLDFTIATRNKSILLFAGKNTDAIYLTNNHSKVIYIEKGAHRMLAIMSNNATNNHRYETGIILWNGKMIAPYTGMISEMISNSAKYG